MPSLSQLLTNHRSLLVLDAASMDVQVGLLRPEGAVIWRLTRQEAGTTIFAATEAVLREAGVGFEQVGALVFCAGPGSMLGIRTVAMALRTWAVLTPRPMYSYQSLAIAAHFAAAQNPGRHFAVIADARRDTWHYQGIGPDGLLLPLQRLAGAELPAGGLLTPDNFRSWASPPRPAGPCSYDLARIFPTLGGSELFSPTDEPDAFQYSVPEYKKWSAQVHSSATADPK